MSSNSLHTALLIDDDLVNNYLNTELLAGSGHFAPLIIFTDPTQAFEYLKTNCLELKTHPLPNLFLIDINMPIMDGFELIRQIHHLCPDIFDRTVVCILTTSTHEKDVKQAKELNVEHFFQKPLTSSHVDTLLKLLAQKKG